MEDQQLIRQEDLKVAASYSTLQETHDLVLRKLGRVRTHHFLKELTEIAIFLTPTTQDYAEAIQRTFRYHDQSISLADSILAEISERLDISLWTFDHHFDVMGARVWRDT